MKAVAASLLAVALLSCPLMSYAALIAVDGGRLVDDPDANLIWVSDANLMATQVDASGNAAAFVSAIINASGGTITSAQGTHTLTTDDFLTADGVNTKKGQMTWYGAQAWVHYLNITDYQGYSDWRLPSTIDSNSSIIGFGGGGGGDPITSSEMGHLFYGELGQVLGQSITTTHNDSYALVNNVQGNSNKPTLFFALAVRTGHVAPLAALLAEVTGVGPGTSLPDKVALAETYYAVPDIQATCELLRGFVNEVRAQAGKKINSQLSIQLLADANAIETAIGCN